MYFICTEASFVCTLLKEASQLLCRVPGTLRGSLKLEISTSSFDWLREKLITFSFIVYKVLYVSVPVGARTHSLFLITPSVRLISDITVDLKIKVSYRLTLMLMRILVKIRGLEIQSTKTVLLACEVTHSRAEFFIFPSKNALSQSLSVAASG